MVTNHTPPGSDEPIVPGLEHHVEQLLGGPVHWVRAGTSGSPVLLVHGFPETWWAFRRLIPLLAAGHQVIAVDLPGFGGSIAPDGVVRPDRGSTAAAAVLHELIDRLGLGPVHLLGQDIAGNTVFRLAAGHREDIRSLVAVETLISGFGLEDLANVGSGGAWHMGALATPGVAEFVFTGRVRQFLTEMWFPFLTVVPDAVSEIDVATFDRAYSQPGAWAGPHGLYASALHDGDDLRALATSDPLRVPVLAVDGARSSATADGMRSVAHQVDAIRFDGVGHHVAMEAPERLAASLLPFFHAVDQDA